MRAIQSLHNPFVNRFNEPVSHRRDEMQSDEYMVWLRKRNDGNVLTASPSKSTRESTRIGRLFASAFGLLILIVSCAVLLKVM